MHDLVVRNGTVIDGSGGSRRRADVAIDRGRIVAIGTSIARGREELDAQGRIVAPGFIDAHAHDDVALLVEPSMTAKISQGVTTCVCGNCGIGPSPLPPGDLPEPLDQMMTAGTPRFAKARDYLQALRDTPAAVNCVPLLGHSALRARVMDRTDRPARDDEIEAMRTLAGDALAAGFHGISTGTFYASASHATTQEIIDVCAPLKQSGGVFATHLRDEGDAVMQAIDEAATIGRALGVTTILSHHKLAGRANHGRSRQTLARIDALQAGQSLGLDCYPYIASSTVLRADRVAMAERVVIATCASHPEHVGRDVRDLVAESGLSLEALCLALRPASAIYFTMADEDVERILAYPGTMIGSDGIPLQARPHPRLWGTFPRVLGLYCRERKLFGLESAVHRMTGLPARRFGLRDRGHVAVGMAADLTVFDPETIIDRATFDDPSESATGIDWVVVNGEVAWRHGRAERLAGRLLARPDPR